ncbi:MAG: hypothetical protein AAGK14_08870 [Verrucomicrobiota bacterium]
MTQSSESSRLQKEPPTRAAGGWRDRVLEAGLYFTAASFLAAAGNFLFQILMARNLPVAEVGYLNAAMAMVGLLSLPLLEGSRALVWSISRQAERQDEAGLRRLQARCLKLLKGWTWKLSLAVAVVFWPLASFFDFPRASLMLVVLLCALAMMWSAVGQVWCAGRSRFFLQGNLSMATVAVRLVVGLALVLWIWPQAEAGVLASLLAAGVFAAVLLGGRGKSAEPQADEAAALIDPHFRSYLAASLCVGGGIFLFSQIDMLLAQRILPPEVLGIYSKAGVLGRAIVWGAYPVLVVYLTHRASRDAPTAQGRRLLVVYAILSAVGVLGVSLLAGPLSMLLAGSGDSPILIGAQEELTITFARAMTPVVVLQAVGVYFLATRRLLQSYTFGGLAILYSLVLLSFATNSVLMLSLIFGAGWGAVLILTLQAVVMWSRAQPW